MSFQQEKFTEIADAIRSKLGTTEKIKPSDFASKISEIQVGGGNIDEAYNEGFEAGKKAENDAFWETYQEGGNRTNYTYAFYGWKDEMFNPTYDITFSRAYATFSYSTIKEIKKILDFSKIPTVYLTDAQVFRFCYDLETIKEVVVCEQNQFDQWFQGCSALKNITFSGKIGQSISFADSKLLTEQSVKNIVNCLATVATTTTITFHADVKSQQWFTDEMKATITQTKGWTLA